MKKPVACKHEPDPDTIEYDKKHGRRAICKHCGAKIFITNFIQPGTHTPVTSRMKRFNSH